MFRKAKDLTDIMNIAYRSKYGLESKANRAGKPVELILHWTAGRYTQFFSDYHINIDFDGSYYLTTEDFSELKYHNYKKNSGSIGVCLASAYNANTNSLGPNPPTPAQIEAMAKVIAVLCEALNLPIDVRHVCTHGESADNEDFIFDFQDNTGYLYGTYGPKSNCERWDLEYLGTPESPKFNPNDTAHRGGTIIREKAKKYRKSFYRH